MELANVKITAQHFSQSPQIVFKELDNIVLISRERLLPFFFFFFLNLWQPCSTGKKVKKVMIHPSFDINAKAAAGVREYYDYDVALIQLETDVHISRAAR